MLVARLAFVATYWAYYRDDWLSVIDIRDGALLARAGRRAGAGHLVGLA